MHTYVVDRCAAGDPSVGLAALPLRIGQIEHATINNRRAAIGQHSWPHALCAWHRSSPSASFRSDLGRANDATGVDALEQIQELFWNRLLNDVVEMRLNSASASSRRCRGSCFEACEVGPPWLSSVTALDLMCWPALVAGSIFWKYAYGVVPCRPTITTHSTWLRFPDKKYQMVRKLRWVAHAACAASGAVDTSLASTLLGNLRPAPPYGYFISAFPHGRFVGE